MDRGLHDGLHPVALLTLRRHLEELEVELARCGQLVVLDRLRQGLARDAVTTGVARIGLDAPDALCTLYEWHDGTELYSGGTLGELWLFPGFHLLPLERALQEHDFLRSSDRWDAGWLPLFADGGGDYYAIDLAAGDGTDAPIIGFMNEEPEQPVEFASLTAMAQALVEAFRAYNPAVDDWRL